MKQLYTLIPLFVLSIIRLPAQQGIQNYIENYYAMLNNLGDASLSVVDRQAFQSEIQLRFFTKATIVYNDLRPEGTRRIRGSEYLDNALTDFPLGITFEPQILEISDLILSGDSYESIVRVRVRFSSKDRSLPTRTLAFVLQIDSFTPKSIVGRIKSIDLASQVESPAERPSTATTPSPPVHAEEDPRNLSAPIRKLERDMVQVQGGTFTMGCTAEQGDDCYDSEKPAYEVTLSSYSIGKYEVTQAQWSAVMGNNPSNFDNCANCPVESVSWEDAQVFIRKLNEMTGKAYRLPTEAEWEYAARGGNQSRGYKYAGSNSVGTVAWYRENSGSKTHEVGGKSLNELGLYDMSGNVYEWCSDWYGEYSSSAQRNPQGPDSGAYRVIRGGSWFSFARYCRVRSRSSNSPGARGSFLGFRLAAP